MLIYASIKTTMTLESDYAEIVNNLRLTTLSNYINAVKSLPS